MARIAGVDLPPQKRLWVGLTSIYGIGQQRARSICAKANVDETKKIKDLTEEEVNQIRQVIESEGQVEGDLRKEVQMNIRRLIEIQCYRGLRHRRNLPVHGHHAILRSTPMKVIYQDLPPVEVAGRKLVGRVLFGLLVLVAALVGATAGLLLVYSTDLPQVEELEHFRPDSITELSTARATSSVRLHCRGAWSRLITIIRKCCAMP